MSPAELAAIIRLVDSALTLASKAGISIAKINAMREASADGHLTPEQIEQLAQSAHDSVRRLG